MTERIKKYPIYAGLIIAAFLLVLFNTAFSPFCNPSYVTHDASVFYVIGRGMKEGLLPYRDLFDHKGLYIYFLYYIAAMIGEKNMMGLFIVFSIVASIFTIFSYKLVYVIKKDYIVSIFSSLALTSISLSAYFSHGSMLCEYLAVTTIMISMYLAVKDIYDGSTFNPKYMLIHGILCGINIFNKPNYTLYFAGLGLYVFINLVFLEKDNKDNIKLLIKNVLYGVSGLIIGTLPCIAYCAINGILSDMFFAVFTFNFSYVDDMNIDLPEEVDTKWKALWYCIERYTNVFLFLITSLIYLIVKIGKDNSNIKRNRNIFLFYIITFIALSFAAFMALAGYTHYLMLLVPYMLPIIIKLFSAIFSIGDKKIINIIVTLVLVASMGYILGGYQLNMNYGTTYQEDSKIKREIGKYVKLDKNTKLLCFGLGSSRYNFLGTIPKEKYFYVPGISYTRFKEPVDAMIDNVKNFRSDVIYYATNKIIKERFGDEILNFLNENYVMILDLSDFKKVYVSKDLALKKSAKEEE